jgi:hypothetical protein
MDFGFYQEIVALAARPRLSPNPSSARVKSQSRVKLATAYTKGHSG